MIASFESADSVYGIFDNLLNRTTAYDDLVVAKCFHVGSLKCLY